MSAFSSPALTFESGTVITIEYNKADIQDI